MPTECFGLGCEGYLSVLATGYLTKNVAQDPSTGLLISLYHVNVVFYLTPTFWGQVYFKQMEAKCR